MIACNEDGKQCYSEANYELAYVLELSDRVK